MKDMTQEDKELLLKDLCARLPYGVKLHIPSFSDTPMLLQQISDYETVKFKYYASPIGIDEVKPYLRPMSSMTKEEKEEWYKESYVDYDCEFQPTPTLALEYCHLSTDWLNKHHFDYRGLIEKDLALEAPEGMYDIKEQ